MENGKQGAFAMLDQNGSFTQYGLTKREYFAGLAMQGISAFNLPYEMTAEQSVKLADALLAELEKTEE